MATPAENFALRYNFSLTRAGTREDIAELTLWFAAVAMPTDWDAFLLDAATKGYDAWSSHVDPSFFTTAVQLEEVIGIHYNAAGHTANEQAFIDSTLWHGTSTGASLPWETSLALSLYTYQRGTFVANGRRKRGRVYLPPVSAGSLDPSNSGYFNNATLPTFFGYLHDWLDDAGKDIAGVRVGDLSVFSRVDGVLRPVTQLTIDAKFDSQRRRENRETAGYLQAAY